MPFRDDKKPRKKRLLLVSAVTVAGLIILYTVAGFWVLPEVARSMLPDLVAARFPVKATIGDIDLNPYLLTVSVREVTLKGSDGGHLVGLAQLYANLQLSSVFRGAIVLKEVRLTGPDALVKILPDGRVNLLTVLPAPEKPPDAQAEDPLQLPVVEVDRFVLDGGKVVFRDLSSNTPLEAIFSPIQLDVQDFSTRVDSESRFDFRAGTEWVDQISGKGQLTVQPLAVQGTAAAAGVDLRRMWQVIQDAVNFEITGGRLDLAGNFAFRDVGKQVHLQLDKGRVDLKRFLLADKGKKEPLVSVPSFSVVGAGFDLTKRRIRVESMQTEDARIRTWISPDGSIQLLDVLLPESPPASENVATRQPETAPAINVDDWNLQIASLAVKNAGIELQDRGISPPVPLIFGPINLAVKNLNTRDNAPASIALDVREEFGAQLKVSGRIGVKPAMADLQLQVIKAAMKKFEPYVKAMASVEIVSGTADVNGQIQFAAGDAAPKLQYRGDLQVDNVGISKRDGKRDLIKFASLAVTGVQLGIEPNGVRIDEIMLDGLDGNLVIEPDGRTNVKRVVDDAKKEATDVAGSLPARLMRAIKESIKGPFPLQIGRLKVKRASARFEDRSLKPEFKLALDSMEGEMIDISTTQRTTPIKVKINGKVDAAAPLGISGSVVPFGEKTNMDMRVTLQDFQLRSISPYAGKHVGYTVEKGRLSLALQYNLSEDIITGKNDILFKQLTLGERTDSPDAVKLPLNLAIALLKDSKGRIKFNIPVSGDINDPKFSAGNVLADTLIKFVTGVVSSPFKVMEGLTGALSSEELESVFFDPGSAVLDADEAKKLDGIASAMRERPSLRLEIKARAFANLDGGAMTPMEPETAMVDEPVADKQQLKELAEGRARSIFDALVGSGNVESKRVKILPVEINPKGLGSQVSCGLSLTAD